MRVRPAAPEDVPTLAGIAARSYGHAFGAILDAAVLRSRDPAHFAARFATEWSRMNVAERDREIVGFSLVTNGNIDMLFVDPEKAGRGAGTALLRVAETDGARSLECFRKNSAARRFYERRGWRVADEYRRGFAGSAHDFVQYRPERAAGSRWPAYAGMKADMTELRDSVGRRMHDWILISVAVDWAAGTATLALTPIPAGQARLVAMGLLRIHLSRTQEWGPSVSINGVEGPVKQEDGSQRLCMEMQSGDTIDMLAEAFQLIRDAS